MIIEQQENDRIDVAVPHINTGINKIHSIPNENNK